MPSHQRNCGSCTACKILTLGTKICRVRVPLLSEHRQNLSLVESVHAHAFKMIEREFETATEERSANAAPQGNIRKKSGAGGAVVKEALLNSKKHRKSSRKRVGMHGFLLPTHPCKSLFLVQGKLTRTHIVLATHSGTCTSSPLMNGLCAMVQVNQTLRTHTADELDDDAL